MRLKVIKKTHKASLREKLKQRNGTNSTFGRNTHPVPASAPQCSPVVSVEVATQCTIGVLVAAGLHDHFVDCYKSKEDSKRMVRRCAQFIVWSYSRHHNKTIDTDTTTITCWFQALMHEHYRLLMSYCEHLVQKKLLAPATVRTYTSDLERCFEWGTLFAPAPMKVPMNSHDGIRKVAELVRTNQARSQRAARSHNTWQEQVRNRRIPAGGLAALQQAVVAELPWARSVRKEDIDDVAYRRFMQLAVSAVYVFSANGRQSGVSDVRMGQVEQLLGEGYTTTTKFKTNAKYGYQPITLGAVAQELVFQYVEVVRPQVCRAATIHPDDHMWVTYRGVPELQVGKLVNWFFIRTLGLSVTTTSIRGLVETTMDQKYKAGQISEAEKIAVQNINGHSSEVTRDYYLYEDRVEDVHRARAAFTAGVEDLGYADDVLAALVEDDGVTEQVTHPPQHLLDLPAAQHVVPMPQVQPVHYSPSTPTQRPPPPQHSAACPLPAPLPLPSFATPPRAHWSTAATIEWGTAHPDYGTAGATARWTWAEKSYLGEWCARFTQDFPEATNVVAKALKAIKMDSQAIAIFHAHHTLNSARLRHGLRQFHADAKEQEHQRQMRQYTIEVVNQINY